MKISTEGGRRLVLALSLIGLNAGSLALAEGGPPTLIDELKKDLLGVQNNITNARVRLRNPIAGVDSTGKTGESPERPPTPAETCCSTNLKNIRKHVDGMNRTFEKLYLYYSDRNEAAALLEMDQVRAQLGVVARGVAVFRMAGTSPQAEQALMGLIRPFNELRAGVERLEACCPVEPAPAADESP